MRFLLYVVFVVTLVLRLLPGNLQNMPFTMDQGRDLVDVRQIWQGKDVRLIGPTTSLNGVFLGPFYYYLISIPHLLSSGHPQAVLVWQIICFHLAIIYFWRTTKKHNKTFADLASILLLLSPITFYTNRYFWNANFMPTFTLVYLTALIDFVLTKTQPKKDILLGLTAGVSLQIEAAFGILFLPFTLLVLVVRKSSLPHFSRFLASFFFTLIPQVIFELAKGFPMTKVLILELTGGTNTLGESLTFTERLLQRKESFINTLNQSSHINPSILIYILLFALLVFVFYKQKDKLQSTKPITKITLSFLIFTFLFYLAYASLVKTWYIYSLSLVFPVLIGSSLSELDPKKLASKIVIGIVISLSLVSVYSAQKEYLTDPIFKSPNNPSAYINQIKIVDDVYKLAKGDSFYLYNYIPSIYDYPFQYLFWSHGLKKYGYSPNDLAYLPNQPEYIKNKNFFLKNTQPVTDQTPTILIIQAGDNKTHLQEWSGNFAHLCEQEKIEYSFGQKVLYLVPCPAK